MMEKDRVPGSDFNFYLQPFKINHFHHLSYSSIPQTTRLACILLIPVVSDNVVIEKLLNIFAKHNILMYFRDLSYCIMKVIKF